LHREGFRGLGPGLHFPRIGAIQPFVDVLSAYLDPAEELRTLRATFTELLRRGTPKKS